MSLEVSHPEFGSYEFSQKLSHEGLMAFGGEYFPDELEIINQIASNTAILLEQECVNRGKSGFMLGISINNKANVIIQIGTVDEARKGYEPDGAKIKFADFAYAKIQFLKDHPEYSRSSQNNEVIGAKTTILNENVVGGAISFKNGIKISISGLSSIAIDDENAVLNIGTAMGFNESISNNS